MHAHYHYIRLRHGHAYLVAVMDWCSRYVLSWELSMSLESGFCVAAFTDVLKGSEIRISMDGRGRALDNIMIERLWRTVKYEEVYLKDCPHLFAARDSLSEYFEFYNEERRHSSLDGRTPSAAYWAGRSRRTLAG